MIPTIAQSEIMKDNHRFRVINCGRRFGKTTLAVEEIKAMSVFKEARIAYIAPTFPQARDIAWQMMMKELKGIILKANETRLEMEVKSGVCPEHKVFQCKCGKTGTSLIQLRGWEAIETLRGQAFDFLVVDEVAMMRNFWINWQEVLRPTLTDRRGSVMFVSTPKGFNHFYELYNKESEDPDFKSFHFTSYANEHLYIEELEQAKTQMTEDRFAQEYLADFRKTEGLVYKEFNRKYHLYDKLPEDTIVMERLLGIDFGFTNPTAMVLLLQDRNGNYWLESEWYKTQQTNDQIVETAHSFKAHKHYADPEAPEKILELKKASLNMMEVTKGKDSIKNGVNIVRELLKQNKLKINKKCTNIIWEFETYSYPEKRPDNPNPEIPIKENDHLLDALRYVVSAHQIKVKSYTPRAYQPVNPVTGY